MKMAKKQCSRFFSIVILEYIKLSTQYGTEFRKIEVERWESWMILDIRKIVKNGFHLHRDCRNYLFIFKGIAEIICSFLKGLQKLSAHF